MRQHQRRVYRVIFLLVRDADIADTLTQECFLRAYKKLASFRGECRIETWLLRIAVNLVRDHGKSRRTSFWKKLVGLEDRSTNDEPREFATPQPSPERILLAREQLQSILSAVSSLPTQQRSIFLLRFGEEMSLAQIADVLEVKVGTVKAQLARATGKLREMKERQWR
jgi:RNA polymerase sigma-70 factor, ECF subfamily